MNSLISPDNHVTLWGVIALGTATAIWLEQKYRWAARLSAPVVALVIAMVLSNVRIAPAAAPAYDFIGDWLVPLAIPLLLFRANLREIIRSGGRLFLIFHISAVGTILGTFGAVIALKGSIGSPETEQAAGLMAGSYMGGSVNFTAVKESYEVGEATVSNPLIVADNFVMAVMFVVLLSIASSAFFRKRFPHPHSKDADSTAARNLAAEHWKRKEISLLDIARAFAFAFAAFAVAELLRRLIVCGLGDPSGASLTQQMIANLITNKFVIITFVSLAMATLFAKPMSQVNGPEEFGSYLLAVFLLTLGFPADLLTVFRDAPLFFLFCGIIAVVNLAFTLSIGRLFRCNLEELLLAVNANLGGAPSAAAMAVSAGWPKLVTPGILVGVWGYVIGTPAGIMILEILTRSL